MESNRLHTEAKPNVLRHSMFIFGVVFFGSGVHVSVRRRPILRPAAGLWAGHAGGAPHFLLPGVFSKISENERHVPFLSRLAYICMYNRKCLWYHSPREELIFGGHDS